MGIFYINEEFSHPPTRGFFKDEIFLQPISGIFFSNVEFSRRPAGNSYNDLEFSLRSMGIFYNNVEFSRFPTAGFFKDEESSRFNVGNFGKIRCTFRAGTLFFLGSLRFMQVDKDRAVILVVFALLRQSSTIPK